VEISYILFVMSFLLPIIFYFCSQFLLEFFKFMLAPFTGQPVQHRGYSKPKTKVNANAWVCNIENGNRGGSANSDA
jgi:hypothetical protein